VNTKHNIQPNEKGELSLASPNDKIKAVFSLNEGGRLKSLYYKNQPVIQDLENTSYAEDYAAAVLFPFANRICDGNYSFQDRNFQLESNEKDSTNAIHGLIYNKAFQLTNTLFDKEENSISLSYTEKNPPKGFPFQYKIVLTYTLRNNSFDLSIRAENKSSSSFPFTMGWHPYFVAKNPADCVLEFDSLKSVLFNQELITIGLAHSFAPNPFPIDKPRLDDCFVLHDNKISFKTPAYHIEINTSRYSKYLQLYLPPNEGRIAIEPMTGISDSFNNYKGVKILNPNELFIEKWNVNFIN
jgi:aldose 1-epimerase